MLEVSRLTVAYSRGLSGRCDVIAVRDIAFSVNRGEILGLIGESGSGKSTILNAIAGLIKPQSGRILYNGKQVAALPKREFAMLFQSAALNPKLKICESIAEPLRNAGKPHRDEAHIGQLLELVKLPASYALKYPHELSGGELQRAAIARALAIKPSVLLADEPVSALDASVRGHVLDLLRGLCLELNLTCVFVTHDLSIARRICDSLCVMKRGSIVERGAKVLDNPENIYTKLLIASILSLAPEQREQARSQRALLWAQYKREEDGGAENDFAQTCAVPCSNDST